MSNTLTAEEARKLSNYILTKNYKDEIYTRIRNAALNGETLIVFPFSDIYYDYNILTELESNGFIIIRSKTNMIRVSW